MKDTEHLNAMIDQFERILKEIENNEPFIDEATFETEFLPIAESLIDYNDAI